MNNHVLFTSIAPVILRKSKKNKNKTDPDWFRFYTFVYKYPLHPMQPWWYKKMKNVAIYCCVYRSCLGFYFHYICRKTILSHLV